MSDERERRGGIDYPVSRAEFERRFGSEAPCRTYLERVRWPEGFVCPGCGGRRNWLTGRGLYRCAACARGSSVTAGTIFAGSRKPLRLWFEALWALAGDDGVSAEAVRVDLGLGSYQTAWAWLHKLRRTMTDPAPERLAGTVELASIPLWSVERGAATVAIAAEVGRGETGRIRISRLPDDRPAAIERFAAQAVAAGATLRTYRRYPETAFPFETGLPEFERVASRLKEWCTQTHSGAIRARQLDFYLAEFAFRYNHRAEPQGLRFYRLLQGALAAAPMAARSLVGGTEAVGR
ncbi:MAG: IS1595 family transposase [Candidatus Limnocylindrales bacterium]